eukprot:tig00000989_g6100.t1
MGTILQISGESLKFVVRDYLELKEEAGDDRPHVTIDPEEDALGQWKMLVYPNGDNADDGSTEHFGVYLRWGDGEGYEANYTITLLSKDRARDVALKSGVHTLHFDGFHRFAPLSTGELQLQRRAEAAEAEAAEQRARAEEAERALAEAQLDMAEWAADLLLLAEEVAAAAAYHQRRAEAAEWALMRAERARAESAAAAERAQAEMAALRRALDEAEERARGGAPSRRPSRLSPSLTDLA